MLKRLEQHWVIGVYERYIKGFPFNKPPGKSTRILNRRQVFSLARMYWCVHKILKRKKNNNKKKHGSEVLRIVFLDDFIS